MPMPPEPIRAQPGGALRFGVGDPASGRSNTWVVFGNENTDDVYIGARVTAGEIKISLHQSGAWRLAVTEQEARRRGLDPDSDRVIRRWTPPAEFGVGWRWAAVIHVPLAFARLTTPEKKSKRGGSVSAFPSGGDDRMFMFGVFMQGATGGALTVNDVIGEVGTLELPGGGKVCIAATDAPITQDKLAEIHNLRAGVVDSFIRKMGIEAYSAVDQPTGAAWGHGGDGRIVVYDLGLLERRLPIAPLLDHG